MEKCWASEFSPCCEKISREHVISKGLFDTKTIYVQGFEWCREEVKIGIESLTAKILCRKHNSLLSSIDKSGIEIISFLEQARDSKYDIPQITTSGHLFEKWLLKTAINLSFNSQLHIGLGMTDSKLGIPSAYLLDVVFGKIEFSHQMGAYFIPNSAPLKIKEREIATIPIVKDKVLGGILFNLRGYHFFISLVPCHELPNLASLGLTPEFGINKELLELKPRYRPTSLVITSKNKKTSELKFYW